MSAGHGGQALLTRQTRNLVGSGCKDLGEHRLKDIPDPLWLYQLGDGEFPPLRSLNNTNLPTPASAFVGREPELDEAGRLLAACRLLTISGPGGADIAFDIAPPDRIRLLEGLDDIGLTLKHAHDIVAWEKRTSADAPWLQTAVDSRR